MTVANLLGMANTYNVCHHHYIWWLSSSGGYFATNSEVPSCIQSNFLWYNKHMLTDYKPVYLSSFCDKNVNYINNLRSCLGNFKSWNVLKTELKLADSSYFSWMQLINAIPLNWKLIIKHNRSSENLLFLNHHLIKKKNLVSLDKLRCRELYNVLVYTSLHKPTSQVYFKNLFREQELHWKEIYILPRKVMSDHFNIKF